MEVEELEQLNPAIKGKKLEIVDEVRNMYTYLLEHISKVTATSI